MMSLESYIKLFEEFGIKGHQINIKLLAAL
jgi:hypothetical protein